MKFYITYKDGTDALLWIESMECYAVAIEIITVDGLLVKIKPDTIESMEYQR